MAALRELFFESSGLAEVARTVSRDELDETISRHQARIVLGHSLARSCYGDFGEVRRLFKRLGELGFERFPEHVSLSRLCQAERDGAHLARTPTTALRPTPLFDLVDQPLLFALSVRKIQHAHEQDVRDSAANDATLRGYWEASSPEHRRAQEALLARGEVSPQMVGSRRDLVWRVLAGDLGDVGADRAIASPKSHRAHVLRAGLITLRILGLQMCGEGTACAEWLRCSNDDWANAHLASPCAYGDFIVSEDRVFRARLSFLAERGYCFLRPIDTDTLLSDNLAA